MKKFEKYGTLLTRSEAKEIKGGNGDGPDPLNPDPEVGGGGNPCPDYPTSDCRGRPCTLAGGKEGTCVVYLNRCACGDTQP